MEVVAAEFGGTQRLADANEVVAAPLTGAEHEGDVRVVGPGEVVEDEGAGIRVALADPLIVADLPGDRGRPAADEATRVGLERCVGGVDADLARRQVDPHTFGPREFRAVKREERHRLDEAIDGEAL